MSPSVYDMSSFLRNTDEEIYNALQKGAGLYDGVALSLTPIQSTRTTSPEMTPVPNNPSDELRRKRDVIQKIINKSYQKGGGTYAGAARIYDGDFNELVKERNKLDSQIKLANSPQLSLSQTPMQPTETTPSEITPVPNQPSGVQRRIDSLSDEDKALFNKFAVNYLEDKDDIVNKMTRAVVNHYPQVFPDLYHVYSTLYTNNPTAPNIENASQWPVSEQESPIYAPQAVANPAQSEDKRSVADTPAGRLSSPASIVKAAVANKASQTTKPKGILRTIDGRFSGPPNTRNPFTPWAGLFTPWAR